MRREINLGSLLVGLRKKNPTRSISQIRLVWPDIRVAIERGHTLKDIHESLVKGGLRIDYKVLSVYVGRLRREDAKKQSQAEAVSKRQHPERLPSRRAINATICVPNRRLFSAAAAAQYLGMNGQTLKKITDLGALRARMVGGRRVYALEDMDRYIELLPKVIPLAS